MKKLNYLFVWVLLFFCSLSVFVQAQDNAMIHTHLSSPPYPVDTWYLVNEGLAPCASNGGTPTGLLDVAAHGDIEITDWLHRRGEMYVALRYEDGGCSRGLYKHDTTTNKWMRVATSFVPATGQDFSGFFTTNGQNIFCLSLGRVYQLIEENEYATYPNGWKEISVAPFSPMTNGQVWTAGCEAPGSDIFISGHNPFERTSGAEAIGDTIFAMFYSTCSDQHKIGKFSVVSGTWTFMPISMPWLEHPANGGLSFGPTLRMVVKFTYPIAGRFQIFIKTEEGNNFGFGNPGPDSLLAVPSVLWAYDYATSSWFNISEGIDYNNATGSANPYNSGTQPGFPHKPRPDTNCINPDKTPKTSGGCAHNGWGTASFHTSFDKKKIYASSASAFNGGLYWWNGEGWVQVVSDIGADMRPTNNGIFFVVSRYSNGQFYWQEGANTMQVGDFKAFCGVATARGYETPDDGKTWYIKYSGSTAGCDAPLNVGGMYRLKFGNTDKPASTYNLHVNSATYLGAYGDNMPVGTGVGGSHNIVVGGNHNAGTITANGPFEEVSLLGANGLSAGKMIFLNPMGDSIIRVVNIGNKLDELDIQDEAPFRIVASGDFGVAVFDSTGKTVIWHRTINQLTATDGLPLSGKLEVDISNKGQVVVGRQSADFFSRAKVYRPDGTPYDGILNPGRKFMTDVTIKNDTIALVGEHGGTIQNWSDVCGTFNGPGGWPIRVPYVFFYAINSDVLNTSFYAKSYDFNTQKLAPDAADAKVNGANFGKDGKLLIVGEQAGANGVFRWDAKTNKREFFESTGSCQTPSTLVVSDAYNRPSVIMNPLTHIGYIGIIDPVTGTAETGSLLYPLLASSGKITGNTLRLNKVNSDLEGYIYAGGGAASQIKARPLININGNIVGPYAGDVTFVMFSPNLKTRMFWGPFNATGSPATGAVRGIGVRDNIISMSANSTRGTFTTVNPIVAQSFSPNNTGLNDSYLATWYQDVWNHSNKDTLTSPIWIGPKVVDPLELTYNAQFSTDKRKVCVGQPVTFINASIGDSILSWNFGLGASLLPGTAGQGPFSVTYSTPGFKTPKLNVTLKNGMPTYETKHEYIEVIAPGLNLNGAITGPSNVCPGSEAVYSVPYTEGITFYEWTFPAGTQIIFGAGGGSVRVVFGSTPGTVSVRGLYACGTTPAITKAVTIATKDENKVTLVVKENAPNTVMAFDGAGDYFESTAGVPTLAYDSSGNANHAIPQNGVTWLSYPVSPRGSRVRLKPGSSDHLTLTTSPIFSTTSNTQPYSVSVWVNPEGTTGTNMILSQKSNTGNNVSGNDFTIAIVAGEIRVYRGRNGGNIHNDGVIANGGPVNVNVWSHISVVKEGNATNQLKIYVNGVLTGQGTHNLVFANEPVRIGNVNNNTFNGEIDELVVWETGLNATQVQQIYTVSSTASIPKNQYPAHANIIGEWDFNEYTGFNGISGAGDVSIEAWVRIQPSTSLPASIVSWGSGNDVAGEMWMGLYGTGFESRTGTFIGTPVQGALTVKRGRKVWVGNKSLHDGIWHHVAVVWKAGNTNSQAVIVYVDGVKLTHSAYGGDGSGDDIISINPNFPVRLGVRAGTPSQDNLFGEIDDVRIWDTELSENAVKSFAGVTSLLPHPHYGNLVYHVHNDPVGATVTTDYSVNGFNGIRQGDAIWVADPAYQADLALKAKLESKGFSVEMLKAGEISNDGNEANCAGLVYISTTVVRSVLQQKLRNITVPTIVANPDVYADMGLVPTGAANAGGMNASQTQVNVTDNTDFAVLASNVPAMGSTNVYSSGGAMLWGRPLASAVIVAQTTDNAVNKTLFGYETGTLLVGSQPAPARRVGFFLSTYEVNKLVPQYGDSLFNRAICWALGNCPTPNTLTTGAVTKSVYCPGDSIEVPFTHTGTFALSGDPADLPNNIINMDIGGAGANVAPQVSIVSSAPGLVSGNGSVNDAYYRFDQGAAPASVEASVAWFPAIPYNGVYKLEYFVPNDPNELTDTANLSLERPDTLNRNLKFFMQANKGGWVDLGNHNFTKSTTTSIRITNKGKSGTKVVADAIRLTLISVNNPEGNDFVLQLSDNTGSFAGNTVIGKVENSNSAMLVKGVLPVFLAQGSGYRVRVVSTAPPLVGTPSPTSISISGTAPEPTGPIIGNAIACAGATIQGYKVVPNPTNATGYLWKIPLGAQFIGPNDRDTVTVQFTTATTNDISVQRVGDCGLSEERTLEVVLAADAPEMPGTIAGRSVVCTSLTSETYTIAPVLAAASYEWTLPAGATATGSVTGNSITVNYLSALQGTGKITVKAVNDCGQSLPSELDVVIDNASTLPVAGAIAGVGILCPNTPDVLYTVTPVAGATKYLWTVSGTGATIDTVTTDFPNQAKLTVGSVNATLSVQIQDACGLSAPSSRTITVGPSPDKKALLITDLLGNIADDTLVGLLEQEGYTVEKAASDMTISTATYCYSLIVTSRTGDAGNTHSNTTQFANIPVPMLVNRPQTTAYTNLTSDAGTGVTSLTEVNIINNSHPITQGFSTGNTAVMGVLSSFNGSATASLPPGATILAQRPDAVASGLNVLWAIEKGSSLAFGVAPARRVGFIPFTGTFAQNLNADGKTLFKRSVCWLTNSCDALAIDLTEVNKTTFCAGEQISATFEATGAIGVGNVFELQISNAAGSFASPTVIGTLTSNSPGIKTITANLPLTLPTGSAYAIRIRSTNTVAFSNEITNLNITQVPAKAGAITGTVDVCPGQTNVAYSVTPVAGADTYTWTLPVGASIVSGQGTTGIVANMSGASSGSVSVTTSAGGCTNTDAQILPLNFTSGNNWTGAVNTEWHNVANWSCGYLPTASSDVTISNVGSGNYPVVSVAGALARNLSINGPAASVTISGGTLSLAGNLTRTAGSFSHTGGTLIMNGTTAQTINMGTPTTFANLTVNNAAGVSLGGSTNSTVTGTLNFVNGRFNIGTSNLIMGNASNILGAGATRYIVVPNDVSATNYVQKQLVNGGLEYTFPIGNAASYNPVSITNSGPPSDVRVRTFAGVYANGNSGALETEKVVNRTWSVVPVNTDANLNIKLQWNNSEHLPLFLSQFARVRTNPAPGEWNIHNPYVDASGSGVLNMSVAGVTGAGKFPLFSISSPIGDPPPFDNGLVLMVVGSTIITTGPPDNDIIGGSLTMSAADSLVHDTLVARGYTVILISDYDDAPDDVNSYKFIWISTSVASNRIGAKYRNVVKPVIVNAAVFANMGLATTNGSEGNSAINALIKNTTHPLSNGVHVLGALNTNFNAHSGAVNFYRTNTSEGFTSGIAYDSSGNGRNAGMTYGLAISSALFSSFWDTTEASPRNTALEFSNGRILRSLGFNGPVGASARSFSGWIKTTGTNGAVVSWGKNNADAAKSITFRVNDTGKMRLDFDNATNFVEGDGGSVSVNDGAWHHVAFTMASGATPGPGVDVKIFVDGVEQSVTRTGTATINLDQNLQNVRYGRNVTGAHSSAQFIGLMDDVAMWNVELTPAEILAIKNNTESTPVHKSVYPQQAALMQELDFIKVRDGSAIPIIDRGSATTGMNNSVFVGFEQGKDLWTMVAPGKRVMFPYTHDSYTSPNGILGSAGATTSFTRILDNTLCWILNSCATMIEINTQPVLTTFVCQGDTVGVSYNTVNTFNTGNIFTVQLSDASGNFTSPTDIGSVASATPSFVPIKAAIPFGTPAGTGYRVRVMSSDPVTVISTDNGSNIEVKTSLPAPGPISGPATVCSGQSGVNYSIAPVGGASFYTWVLPSGATGTSLTETITVNMATATAGMMRVSAGNGTCATPTSDLPLSFNTANTWSGTTSTAWNVATNWSCGQVPNINTDVVIPNMATNMPTISTADAVARDLTVDNGGVLTITPAGVLNLKGDLTLNGANAISTASCGTVVFSDTIALQTISANDTARFCNLTVNNPLNVQLLQHARISGTMHFARGKFVLQDHDLVMTAGGTITGVDSNRYIVTRNVPLFAHSFLIRPVGAAAVAFPVGTPTSYNPARISNSGTSRPIKVRAFTGAYEWGTSGTVIPMSVLNRTWEIEPIPAVAHGVNADITLQWKTGDQRINFIPEASFVRKNRGGSGEVWQNVTSSAHTDLGDGNKEITGSGVTTFSKFTVFSDQALPLSLLEFVGYNIEGKGQLYWKTTRQQGTAYFEVEKSADGIRFERIGRVDAKSGRGINEYAFTDEYLVHNSYYRLRMVDEDGEYEYSSTVLIRAFGTESGVFSLYPNPTKHTVTIGYEGLLSSSDAMSIKVYNLLGVELLNMSGSIAEMNAALNGCLNRSAASMYMVQIMRNGDITRFKLLKEE